jgi:5-methylcytosine-specific restriction endonuclease McrA
MAKRKTFDSSEYHKAMQEFDGIHCLGCGQELPPLTSKKERGRIGSVLFKCCNEQCKKAFLDRTLKNWAELREIVIKRDGYTCRDCGYIAPTEFVWEFVDYTYEKRCAFGPKPNHMSYHEFLFECGFKAKITKTQQTKLNLEVHHNMPIKDGGAEFDIDNCVTLCIECHKARHSSINNYISKQRAVNNTLE